jgi:hypothetical protein
VHGTGIAAKAVDLLHDDARCRQAESRAPVLLGNHGSEPASLHQRGHEALGIGALFVDLAEIRSRELSAETTDCVADLLMRVGLMQHGLSFAIPKEADTKRQILSGRY